MVRIQIKYIKNDVKTSKAKFKTQWKNNEGHNRNDLRFRKLNANRTELHQSESSVRSLFFSYKEYLTKILLFFFLLLHVFGVQKWRSDPLLCSLLLRDPRVLLLQPDTQRPCLRWLQRKALSVFFVVIVQLYTICPEPRHLVVPTFSLGNVKKKKSSLKKKIKKII